MAADHAHVQCARSDGTREFICNFHHPYIVPEISTKIVHQDWMYWLHASTTEGRNGGTDVYFQ